MWRAWRHFPWGPAAGVLVFWLTVGLSSAVVFGSIARQLYGAPPAPTADIRDAWCVAEMARLSVELADRAAERLEHDVATTAQRGRWVRWQADVRARLAAARAPCAAHDVPPLAAAFAALERLSEAQEEALQQADAGPAAARQALRAALAAAARGR